MTTLFRVLLAGLFFLPCEIHAQQILGVTLRDLQTGRAYGLVNDGVPDDVRDCAMIEIQVDGYLQAPGSPGSMRKVLKNASGNVELATQENEYPYGWEDDEARCYASLSVIGVHTLEITPYSGDNLSGTAGPTLSMTFTVHGPQPEQACQPTGQGFECPGHGSKFRVEVPSDAVNATDRDVSMQHCCPHTWHAPTTQVTEAGKVYQYFPISPTVNVHTAQAYNCLRQLDADGNAVCVAGETAYWGTYNGVALPEFNRMYGLGIGITAIAILGLR